jgi:uncharacterized protein YbjT (DUF2867 family)
VLGDRPHLACISVVGAERMPVSGRIDPDDVQLFRYEAEGRGGRVAGSGLPWTTIRATQFHDLIFMVVEKLAMLPLVPVLSGVAFQPVDSDEVAARLVELALGHSPAPFPTSQDRACTAQPS